MSAFLWNRSVNHLDFETSAKDSLADTHLTKKRRYGTGGERATTVIERYRLWQATEDELSPHKTPQCPISLPDRKCDPGTLADFTGLMRRERASRSKD